MTARDKAVTPMSMSQESGNMCPDDQAMVPILHDKTTRNVPTFVEDQANLALFLGSDMSRCINGQIIVCDNGQFL